MLREVVTGVALYRFGGLDGAEGVIHAVLTRTGGVSEGPYATLNLGHTVGDDPAAVQENHRRALGALGLDPRRVVSPYQAHGAQVAAVGRAQLGTIQPGIDGLVTGVPGVPLVMRFADCTPVLFFDLHRRAVGIAHAGWRGIVAGVVGATVEALTRQLGCDPAHVWAGIGPCIGPCCYEVGAQVAEAAQGACPDGAVVVRRVDDRLYLDMPACVSAQLQAAGVAHIEKAGLCTACRVGEFFSHRAENGRTGRFGAVIGLQE